MRFQNSVIQGAKRLQKNLNYSGVYTQSFILNNFKLQPFQSI